MSREVRRVPLDFAWPIDKTWEGYLLPDDLALPVCPDCGGAGWSPAAKLLQDRWYGYAPFEPADRGSQPLTHETPAVRAFAERNVSYAPGSYGTGEEAIVAEGQRLAGIWNGMWLHHLNQDDVDALLAADRLRDLTHTWSRAEGWQPKDPPHVPTVAEVNSWSITNLSGPALHPVMAAELERLGEPANCSRCGGLGDLATDEQREAHDEWRPTDPPLGEGWQMWETVSEGSPISPVFPDRDSLVSWLTTDYQWGVHTRPLTLAQAEAFVTASGSMGSFVVTGGRVIDGVAAVADFKSYDGPGVTEPPC